MDYGKLTYQEIKIASLENWIVIIPTGCTEQQGPHLTVDFDTWFSQELCLAASKKAKEDHQVNSLVLPVLPFGPTPEHRNFGYGFIDLPQSLHEDIIFEVVKSIKDQGFRRLLIWPGCGQHDFTNVVKVIKESYKEELRILIPDNPFYEIWKRVGNIEIPGGHADSFSTSIAMYLKPESVRMERIENPENLSVDWSDPNIDFSKYSSTGVIGDPTRSSKELGKKLFDESVKFLSNSLLQFNSE